MKVLVILMFSVDSKYIFTQRELSEAIPLRLKTREVYSISFDCAIFVDGYRPKPKHSDS